MSLRSRLVAFECLLAAIVVAAGFVLVALGNQVEAESAAQTQRWQPASLAARALVSSLVDQETGERGYVITGVPSYLVPYVQGKARSVVAVADLRPLIGTDAVLDGRLDAVEAGIQRWREVGPAPEIAAVRLVGLERARALVATGRGKAAFDDLRGRVAALQAGVDLRLQESNATLREANHRLDTTRLILLGALLAMVAAAGVAVHTWVVRPVTRMQQAMRAVAAGDLEVPIPVTGPQELADLSRDAETMRVRLVEELDAARAARESLEDEAPLIAALRRELTAELAATPGVRVAGALRPAEGVLAGDWYGAVVTSAGRTALILTDVAGHGAEAGVVAAWLKRTLSTSLRLGHDVRDTFGFLAESFAHDAGSGERFASAVVVLIDPVERRLDWVNAGHPAPLLVTSSHTSQDQVVRRLEPTGPILSALQGSWHTATTRIAADELVALYSDGLSEARDQSSEELGEDGILRALERLADADPETAVRRCQRAFDLFAMNPRRDDVTVLAAALDASTFLAQVGARDRSGIEKRPVTGAA